MKIKSTDVLVIGGGCAGLSAALSGLKAGADVTLVDKGRFGYAGCSGNSSAWQPAVAVDPVDSPETHFKDSVVASGHLSNQRLLEVLVDESLERVKELEKYGIVFCRDEEGRFFLQQLSGHSVGRSLTPGSSWPLAQAVRRRGGEILEHTMVTKLFKKDDKVVGAFAVSKEGEFVLINAKATVLATGGAGQIYGPGSVKGITTNPVELTGDGYVLAFEAGAELIDMEFIQYLLANREPSCWRGVITISGAQKDYIFDSEGNYWLQDIPLKEMDRARLCKEVEQKINRGFDVYLDLEAFEEWKGVSPVWEHDIEILEKSGFGPDNPVEIEPTFHHFCGGVAIDEDAETSVNGLFAAGEASGGVHGGTRLGGNAFASCVVFGSRAGKNAADLAEEAEMSENIGSEKIEEERERILSPLNIESEFRPYEVRRDLQEGIVNGISVITDKEKIKFALDTIENMEDQLDGMSCSSDRRRHNRDWLEALETRNMAKISKIILKAKMLRKESRKSHLRSDYPERDDENWLKNIYVRREDGEIKLFEKELKTTEKGEELIENLL